MEVTTARALIDGNAGANNIRGNTVTLTAGTALGSLADEIDTDVTRLTATSGNAGAGGLFIDELATAANGLLLNLANAVGADGGAAGDVVIRTLGALVDDNAGALNIRGATVTLTAGTSIGGEYSVSSRSSSKRGGSSGLSTSPRGSPKAQYHSCSSSSLAYS